MKKIRFQYHILKLKKAISWKNNSYLSWTVLQSNYFYQNTWESTSRTITVLEKGLLIETICGSWN